VDTVNRAEGDSERFTTLYREYSKAKDVTIRRIYLEKMSEVLQRAGKKFIVDPRQKSVIPLMNMMTDKPDGEPVKGEPAK
jgi:membrane protease subunit HflK